MKTKKIQKTILIAEDDETLNDLYAAAFEAAGFEVFRAVNGQEALDILEKEGTGIRIVLLDIIMPKMDGLVFLEKVKRDSRFKKIPVVVCTSLFNDEDEAAARRLGAKEYLVKSLHTPTQIINKVKKYF